MLNQLLLHMPLIGYLVLPGLLGPPSSSTHPVPFLLCLGPRIVVLLTSYPTMITRREKTKAMCHLVNKDRIATRQMRWESFHLIVRNRPANYLCISCFLPGSFSKMEADWHHTDAWQAWHHTAWTEIPALLLPGYMILCKLFNLPVKFGC